MRNKIGTLTIPALNTVLVAAVMFASLSAAPAGADTAKTRVELQAVLDRLSRYIEKQDVEGMASLMDPSVKFVYPGGKPMNLEDWKEATRKALFRMSDFRSSIKVNNVADTGKTARATVTEVDTYSLTADKGHKFREVGTGGVTFVRGKSGWLAVKFVFESDKITRDGKPFTPKH